MKQILTVSEVLQHLSNGESVYVTRRDGLVEYDDEFKLIDNKLMYRHTFNITGIINWRYINSNVTEFFSKNTFFVKSQPYEKIVEHHVGKDDLSLNAEDVLNLLVPQSITLDYSKLKLTTSYISYITLTGHEAVQELLNGGEIRQVCIGHKPVVIKDNKLKLQGSLDEPSYNLSDILSGRKAFYKENVLVRHLRLSKDGLKVYKFFSENMLDKTVTIMIKEVE